MNDRYWLNTKTEYWYQIFLETEMSNNQPNSQTAKFMKNIGRLPMPLQIITIQNFVLHSIFVLTLLMRIEASHTATNYIKHCSKILLKIPLWLRREQPRP